MEKAMRKLFEEEKKLGCERCRLSDDVLGFETMSPKWGYVETPEGLYLLDHEACGPGGSEVPLTAEGNTVSLPIYHEKKGSMQIGASMRAEIDADFVRGLDKIGEENFADFVRVFGGRIESNFSNWNRHLEAEIIAGQNGRTEQTQEASV